MLFHIKHTHTAESCPYDKPEVVKSTWGKVLTTTVAGVKIVGGYVDPPAHAFYLILEANKADQIEEFLAPVMTAGKAKISPVSDYKDVLARRSK